MFLTDGVPTIGTTGIDAIATMVQTNNAEVGARLFSFGIGNDVNTVLLDRLARDSAGDVIYIRPDQSVAVAVQAFWQQLADPVLSDPAIDFGAFAAADLFPDVMSDLFAGRTVMLFGRYGTPGQAMVSLAGVRAGQAWSAAFDVTLPDYALDGGYIPRVWALRQVGRLLADIKQGNTDPLLATQVMALAARFGVTTNFTYFAANAEGDVALRYAGVPTEQTGSVAVDTSTALRDYGSGSGVMTSSNPSLPVRYAADRTFAAQGGYLTDTKLTGNEVDVELTFGSDRYFAFAEAEAAFGAGSLLAAGTNVRFELLGRAFRVTDPAALPRSVGELPPESPAVPDPVWRPVASATTAVAGTITSGPTAPPAPVTEIRRPVSPTARAARAAPLRRRRRDVALWAGAAGGAGAARAPEAKRARRGDGRDSDHRAGAGVDRARRLRDPAARQPAPERCRRGRNRRRADAGAGVRRDDGRLRQRPVPDLSASVGPGGERRTTTRLVEGVSVTPGYGLDYAILGTGFSVGGDRVLSFGGRQSDMQNPRALRAAEQLWRALAGATETVQLQGITRTTPGRRVACSRDTDPAGAVSAQCVMTGFLNLSARRKSAIALAAAWPETPLRNRSWPYAGSSFSTARRHSICLWIMASNTTRLLWNSRTANCHRFVTSWFRVRGKVPSLRRQMSSAKRTLRRVIREWLGGNAAAPLLLRHCEVCGDKSWRPLADTVRGVTIDANCRAASAPTRSSSTRRARSSW